MKDGKQSGGASRFTRRKKFCRFTAEDAQLLHPQHVPDLQDRGEHLWDTLPGHVLGIVVSRRLPLP